MMTDVPIGACLSGGIDSSSICALSGAMTDDPEKFKVFTVFHPGANYDERQYSRAVVEKFGFQSIEVEPDLNDLFSPRRFEEIAYFQDQPVPSGSSYNEYMVSKTARESGVTVLLDGQGADEYFGGYHEFKSLAQRDHLRRLDFAEFVRGIPLYGDAKGNSVAQALKGLARDLSPVRRPVRKSATADLRRLDAGAAAARKDFLAVSLEQLVSTSLPHQLHSLDRNSMHWSVEARAPMTDFRLVELVLSLPTKYKVGGGFQKRILRDAVADLPDMVARRLDKIGFASPDGEFMRRRPDVVRPMLTEALACLARLVPAKAVMSHFEAMIEGRLPYDHIYFRLLSFHGWANAFGIEI
jgi:asparagine synthase (glutamine-hydrolysing)